MASLVARSNFSVTAERAGERGGREESCFLFVFVHRSMADLRSFKRSQVGHIKQEKSYAREKRFGPTGSGDARARDCRINRPRGLS